MGDRLISGNALSRTQLARLLQLILAIQSGRHPNANQLASLCEVSRRTIYRDLDALIRAGVPVRYRTDRQGYELGSNFFLEPTRLEEDEAAALLLQTHRDGLPDWPSLRNKAELAALKCARGLPEEVRRRVLALAELLETPVSEPANAPTWQSQAHWQAQADLSEIILQAALERQQLRLRYRDPRVGDQITTRFGVYRLHSEERDWWLVGRSSYHREVLALPLPWIEEAELTGDSYEIPPRFRTDRSFSVEPRELNPADSRSRVVQLQLPTELVNQPLARPWAPEAVLKRRDRSDGQAILCIELEDPLPLLRWVISQGGAVQILDPADLRASVRELALRLAQTHIPFPNISRE